MKTISASALKQRLESGETVYLIDVREPSEYAESNIGGLLIPLGQIAAGQIEPIEEWRNEEVIVHCRSGMRSMQACMLLEQMGFTNTVNVEGGILAYLNE